MKLVARQIKKQLGVTPILRGIDIVAKEKQFVGILGPNGSGKSTLLKCLYRVLQPDEGEILLNGQPLHLFSMKQSAKELAVVEQHNEYNFDFSVEEIVLMGRSPHKRMLEMETAKDYEIVEAALREVGMEEFRNRSFSSLSGGEKQRVMLARALAQETGCLILDEPTNHLDIKYQLELMELVKTREVTVIAAIHDLNIAAMYCDYLYLLKDGKVVTHGEPKEVLTPENNTTVYEDEMGQMHILYYA